MPDSSASEITHGIQFDDVCKQFTSVRAVDQVSLNITNNETTAIVGPSGCGKSTLLRLANALQLPDSGTVYIDNTPLAQHNIQALRRRIGYCVQHIGLFPHLSIKANIILLAQLEHWPSEKIQSRLNRLLELTALDRELLTRYPHQLSGGQQQRAGLCRALMLQPDFLLLDEPFAAVDPITRIDIHEQYQRLQQQEKRTTLLVTHDIREALALADSIVVMHGGRLLAHLNQTALQTITDPESHLLDLIRRGHA